MQYPGPIQPQGMIPQNQQQSQQNGYGMQPAFQPPPPSGDSNQAFSTERNNGQNYGPSMYPPPTSQTTMPPNQGYDYSYTPQQSVPPPPSDDDFEGGSLNANYTQQSTQQYSSQQPQSNPISSPSFSHTPPPPQQQQLQQSHPSQQFSQVTPAPSPPHMQGYYPQQQTTATPHIQQQQQQQQTYPQQQGENLSTSQASFFTSNSATNFDDKLPRPISSSIFYDVPQPDVSPLFERRNQQSKVDMSKAQSSSHFLRTTVQCIPNASALLTKWKLPFGAIIHPFAEAPSGDKVPVVNMPGSCIIRCYKCRTYINPFCVFIEGGRSWQCNLCKRTNSVPNEYFCPLDEFGQRKDISKRPELCCGSVDFIAPQEYMARAPQPPVYFFLIDVSYPAIASGMLRTVAETIKNMLDELPGEIRTRVGFITFDSTIHFYNLKSTLSQPQMLVVGEIEEPMFPIPSDLLVNLDESRQVVDALLDRLSTTMFSQTNNAESALGAALNAAGRILGKIGGKLLVFLSNLPTLGPNALTNRDNPSIYNTESEKQLLNPAHNNYKELALVFSRDQICVDLFVTSEQYIDLATLSCLPKFTGGETRYYPHFKADNDGEQLRQDLIRTLTRETGFEAVMRIRLSSGLKVNNFFGHLFIRSHDLLALPNIDADKAFGIEIGLSGNFISTPAAAIQAAVLYTSSDGERRIRVHNLTLPITSSISDMYKFSDIDSTMTLLAKMCSDDIAKYGLNALRQKVRDVTVSCLSCYRENVSKSSTSHHLILPDTLRLLPLYACTLSKMEMLCPGSEILRPDERMATIQKINVAPVSTTMLMIYPTMFSISDYAKQLEASSENLIPTKIVPLARKYILEHDLYLLNDSTDLYLFIGKEIAADNNLVNDIMELVQNLNTGQQEEETETEASSAITNAIKSLVQLLRSKFGFLTVRLTTEIYSRRFHLRKLLEDKTFNNTMRYDEYARQIHQQIG